MTTLNENKGIKGEVRIITRRAGTDEIIRTTPWMRNLIMRGTNTGIDLILDALAGTYGGTLGLDYGEIGTSATAPAITDVALTASVARAIRAYAAVSGATLTVQYFFPDAALTNTTYREFGTFVGGTATIATGALFNHILFSSNYVKSAGEDTTIEVQFTIT